MERKLSRDFNNDYCNKDMIPFLIGSYRETNVNQKRRHTSYYNYNTTIGHIIMVHSWYYLAAAGYNCTAVIGWIIHYSCFYTKLLF